MKFTMAIKKQNKVSIGRSEGHNNRLHATKSQLPQSAWFTSKGRHEVTKWRPEVLEVGKALAKRKDAVVAIELVIQVGNQTDWREMPTPEHPYGKPKPGAIPKLKALMKAARMAAVREFGEKNVIGIDLHTDESSPHVHIVVTPVLDGKLQTKNWTAGKVKCAQLRARIHEVISHYIECHYEKGDLGGQPHDPAKGAGRTQGPQPTQDFLRRVIGDLSPFEEVKKLRSKTVELRQQLQMMFSRLKRSEKEMSRQKEQGKQVEFRAMAAERKERELRKKVFDLEELLQATHPQAKSLAPQLEPKILRGSFNLEGQA